MSLLERANGLVEAHNAVLLLLKTNHLLHKTRLWARNQNSMENKLHPLKSPQKFTLMVLNKMKKE